MGFSWSNFQYIPYVLPIIAKQWGKYLLIPLCINKSTSRFKNNIIYTLIERDKNDVPFKRLNNIINKKINGIYIKWRSNALLYRCQKISMITHLLIIYNLERFSFIIVDKYLFLSVLLLVFSIATTLFIINVSLWCSFACLDLDVEIALLLCSYADVDTHWPI